MLKYHTNPLHTTPADNLHVAVWSLQVIVLIIMCVLNVFFKLQYLGVRSRTPVPAVFRYQAKNMLCMKRITWTASSEFGTYRLCEQRRFKRALRGCQNLRCSLIQAVSQEEPSDRKPDPWPLWKAGHAQLKFVMTECSKTRIRLTCQTWGSGSSHSFSQCDGSVWLEYCGACR